MSENDLQTLDTLDTADYIDGHLSDEGTLFKAQCLSLWRNLSHAELEIPFHMVPPDPDDADTLPSQVHPSYPYGNPTNLSHPAALPHIAGEPGRSLYEDMGYTGVNAALRWKDLGLEMLLPVNEEKEEAERAALARKMASGAIQSNHAGASVPEDQPNDDDDDTDSGEGGGGEEENDDEEEEEEEGDGDDENENDPGQDSLDSGMTGDSE